jgi:hypothetical protein
MMRLIWLWHNDEPLIILDGSAKIRFDISFRKDFIILLLPFKHVISQVSGDDLARLALDQGALPILLVVVPLALEDFFFHRIKKAPFAVALVVYEFADIDTNAAILAREEAALPISFVILPVALIEISIEVDHLAEAELEEFFVLSEIDVSVRVQDLSIRCSYSLFELSDEYKSA